MYKTEFIYSPVMCLLSVKCVKLKDIFKYELSPILLSPRDENRDSWLAKRKADLKNTFKEKVSSRACLSEDAVVMDGCAFRSSIHCPKASDVSNLVNVFQGLRNETSTQIKFTFNIRLVPLLQY